MTTQNEIKPATPDEIRVMKAECALPPCELQRQRERSRLAPCSAFLAWFEEQAGKPRLNEVDYLKLVHETVPQLRADLERAERELAAADRYRTAKEYALYAWCAKGSPNVPEEPRRVGCDALVSPLL